MTEFTENVIKIIQSIPSGKVMTYGQIAILCGSSNGARQVVRILYSMTEKYDLPWHRVISARGFLSTKNTELFLLQKALLTGEGIVFLSETGIDLNYYLYQPIT